MKKPILILLALLASAVAVSAQSGGLVNATRGFPQPNDGSTGTTLYKTAKINSSGNAIAATTTDTTVPIYVVIGGAGTTGNAVLASAGTLAPCTMDSTISSGAGGYYVINSTTISGDCHAQASPPAAGVFPLGFLHDGSTVAGSTALVQIPGEAPGIAQNGGGSVTQNTVLVPELLINGGNNVTGSNFNWSKSFEQPDLAWLGPTFGAITNIVQWQHSNCLGGAGQNTCTAKFASNIGGSNAVLLFVNTGNTVTMNNGGTVTDSLSNTYTEVAHGGGSGGGTPPYIFAACGVTAGQDTLTFTATANGAPVIDLEAVEIYGAPTTNCFDQSGFSTASLSVSTSGSVAQASEQVVAMFVNNDTTGANVTFTPGAGYTLFDQDQGCTPSCSSAHQTLESQAGNSTTGLAGGQTATATVSGSTTNLNAIIATVKLSTTGGAPPTFKPIVIQNLPVTTFTPTPGDCVSWSLSDFTNYQLADSGVSCSSGGSGNVSIQSNVTGSRSLGTVFHNTLSQPLFVSVYSSITSTGTIQAFTDGNPSPTTNVSTQSGSTGFGVSVFFVVLAGNYYEVSVNGGSATLQAWTEWH